MTKPKTYIKSRCCNYFIMKTSNSYEINNSDLSYYCGACSKLIRYCWWNREEKGDIWADEYKDLTKEKL